MAKTVLITGASAAVGSATAEAFLADDWTVWATAPDEGDVADLAEQGCETAELDVTNARECERVVEDLIEETGRLDCLVNAASVSRFGAVEDVSTEHLHEQFDVTVYGPHRLIREALPHMRARENGTVVNVSSITARLSTPGRGADAAAMSALEGLSDAVRVEADPFGVDVVVVEPGPIRDGEEPTEDEPDNASGAYDWLYRAREDSRLTGVQDALGVTPGTVALAVRDAANNSDPEPRYPVGEGAKLLLFAEYVPERWRDTAFGVLRQLMG